MSWVFGNMTIEYIINHKLLYFSMLLHWYEVEAVGFIVLLIYLPLSSGLFKLTRFNPMNIKAKFSKIKASKI